MGEIKKRVISLIEKHHSNDPFKIARERNIQILFENLGNILGYYSYHNRFQFIHINNKLNDFGQRFVCSHELGHAIFHPKANTPFLKKNTFFSIDRIELEANTFAVELLLTDDIVKEYKSACNSIYEIAKICGIPQELAHLKNFNH
ncbi:ImmA/IrrE family metallo-endopeptidase [Bacillus sp. Gen3]|nr:ImmA/IrrE family metallo-endopeptidase [Bacillus sp. Gen3]